MKTLNLVFVFNKEKDMFYKKEMLYRIINTLEPTNINHVVEYSEDEEPEIEDEYIKLTANVLEKESEDIRIRKHIAEDEKFAYSVSFNSDEFMRKNSTVNEKRLVKRFKDVVDDMRNNIDCDNVFIDFNRDNIFESKEDLNKDYRRRVFIEN